MEGTFSKQTNDDSRCTIHEQPIKSFTDLRAWQHSHQLVLKIYQLTKKFPKEETFGLTKQMRTAAVSVTSNLAEGYGRQTFKEKIHFYYQAKGSLTELQNQILIAKDVGYLFQKDFQDLAEKAVTAHKIITGLIKKTKSYIS